MWCLNYLYIFTLTGLHTAVWTPWARCPPPASRPGTLPPRPPATTPCSTTTPCPRSPPTAGAAAWPRSPRPLASTHTWAPTDPHSLLHPRAPPLDHPQVRFEMFTTFIHVAINQEFLAPACRCLSKCRARARTSPPTTGLDFSEERAKI